MGPWRERRDRHYLGAVRRVAEQRRLVTSQRRSGSRFLRKGAAALPCFESGRRRFHQRIRVESRPERCGMQTPSTTDTAPLVFFVPSTAMDTLHKVGVPVTATMDFLTRY